MLNKSYFFLPAQRFKWAKIWLILIFSIFALRLFQLQVLKGDYYWRKAEKNRIQYFYIPAPRGRIFDRKSRKLAGNQPVYSLYIASRGLSVEEKNKIVKKLSRITGRSRESILKRFRVGDILPFGVIKLITYLSREEIVKIEENIHHLRQASIQIEPRRKYPFGENGSHFLGYIGEINKLELGRMKKYGYKLKDKVGKCGLEKVYDGMLRGSDGFQEVEVGVTGTHRRIINTCMPEIGNDLLLTIDWDLQEAAMRAMGDRAGAVVAMKPKTGEILIWLSKPGFNPEDFTLPLSIDKAKEIFEDPEYPLFDRVIQGQYAPGSVFKLITAISALELDILNVNTEYICKGSIKIGYDKKVYRCWKDKKHGRLNLLEAIANSCNVYFYQLGMDIGVDVIYKNAKKMGLGKLSQGIFEGEKTGLIPDRKWKKKHAGTGWYPGDTANMCVGQGYVLINPLQVLKMISVIATEGKMYTPHIVKMVVSSDKKVLEKNTPKLEKNIDISIDTFKKIKEAMKKVTDYGTAKFLNLPFEVASKTGTAEAPSGDDHGWFACFAPVDDPEIAIVVLVENGGYGSVSAMPVARGILKAFKLK